MSEQSLRVPRSARKRLPGQGPARSAARSPKPHPCANLPPFHCTNALMHFIEPQMKQRRNVSPRREARSLQGHRDLLSLRLVWIQHQHAQVAAPFLGDLRQRIALALERIAAALEAPRRVEAEVWESRDGDQCASATIRVASGRIAFTEALLRLRPANEERGFRPKLVSIRTTAVPQTDN